MGFYSVRNYGQALRYAAIAATKLKQLKVRRLDTVKEINVALVCKFDVLGNMGRYREAKECAKECYTLWAMNHLRNPGSMNAALSLVHSCIHNNEYEDAEHYARHAMFMINDMNDNFIPADQRSKFLAEASYCLARAIFQLTQTKGTPPEEKKKAGEEAITLARQALDLHTQLRGAMSVNVAHVMKLLADVLDYFNDVDDDKILRLYEQSIAIDCLVDGTSSFNTGASNCNLGEAYDNRARRAQAAGDLDRSMANLEMALPHLREALRIFRAITNQPAAVAETLRLIAQVEDRMQQIRTARTSATSSSSTTTPAIQG